MPYIKDKDKHEMSNAITEIQVWIESKGDLNYAICELVGRLILDSEKISYTQMSEWIDGVHDAETELRRRLLEEYENLKILENGDVPSFVGILERIKEK
jgi:predicted translin family RNA/ssDNA-binding protein